MGSLQVRIEVDFFRTYDGKHKDFLKKNNIKLPSFNYSKTVKVEQEVDHRQLEKEFLHSADGLFASIEMIINGICKDALDELDRAEKEIGRQNKGGRKDRKAGDKPDRALEAMVEKLDFVVLGKKGEVELDAGRLQSQFNRELTPYLKTLTRLLEGTIDELGGNDAATEDYDPADDKATPKYLDTLDKLQALAQRRDELAAALRPRKAMAAALFKDRQKVQPGSGGRMPQDDAWLDLIAEIESDFAAFDRSMAQVQKWLKARKPELKAQKPAQKETPAQKERREALNALAAVLDKMPKRTEAVSAFIAGIGRYKDTLLKMLREGRSRFRESAWPEVPRPDEEMSKLQGQIAEARKHQATIESLFKKAA